ncbi:MAG: shikimate dehydrogenase, partial [Christensenellaceae bacterium]
MAKSFPILCGSIAGSIGGMGVKMHNAAFKHLNLPYTYVSFEPETLKGAVDAMRTLNIRGLAVTMPYKQDVIQYLDDVDDMSKEIGAINTIVNTEGRLVGYNTDVYGFTKTIQKVTALENKKVVVLGAGGIAKTIIW